MTRRRELLGGLPDAVQFVVFVVLNCREAVRLPAAVRSRDGLLVEVAVVRVSLQQVRHHLAVFIIK